MKICDYCKTKQTNKKICSFCESDLTQTRPQKKQILSQEEAYQSQPVLATYHTYDLLLFLKHLRAERTDYYKIMQTVRKAPDEAKNDNYVDLNEDGQQIYRELTSRKHVIEQILVDRMGYYPKRIDNKLLDALNSRINKKGMIAHER